MIKYPKEQLEAGRIYLACGFSVLRKWPIGHIHLERTEAMDMCSREELFQLWQAGSRKRKFLHFNRLSPFFLFYFFQLPPAYGKLLSTFRMGSYPLSLLQKTLTNTPQPHVNLIIFTKLAIYHTK